MLSLHCVGRSASSVPQPPTDLSATKGTNTRAQHRSTAQRARHATTRTGSRNPATRTREAARHRHTPPHIHGIRSTVPQPLTPALHRTRTSASPNPSERPGPAPTCTQNPIPSIPPLSPALSCTPLCTPRMYAATAAATPRKSRVATALGLERFTEGYGTSVPRAVHKSGVGIRREGGGGGGTVGAGGGVSAGFDLI